MSENNLHILLVDDDDKIRELLKTFLVDNKFLYQQQVMPLKQKRY